MEKKEIIFEQRTRDVDLKTGIKEESVKAVKGDTSNERKEECE